MTDRHFSIKGIARSAALGLAVATVVASSPMTALAQEIHVMNWKGWGTDEAEAVAEFEKMTGFKVVHDYITSYPEVFTKLRTNPGTYDVVVLNAAFVGQAQEEGLLDTIDASKLENYDKVFPEMRESPQMKMEGNVYAVPWIWGATSVTYNTKVFPEAPSSLSVLWDPKYADRVCWRDNPEDSVRFAALALGQNPDKPEDLDAITEKLKSLKPQIKAFWKSEDEWRKLVSANECDLTIFWTSSANKAIKDGFPVAYFVADEGAIAFRDGLVIPADSSNRDAAHKFIDYMISRGFYQLWVEKGGAPISANAEAVNDLPDSSPTRKMLSDPETVGRINFKGPLSEEQRQAYLDLWQETKAHFAR